MITCTGTSDTLNAEQYLTYTSQSSLNLTDGVGTSNLGGKLFKFKKIEWKYKLYKCSISRC